MILVFQGCVNLEVLVSEGIELVTGRPIGKDARGILLMGDVPKEAIALELGTVIADLLTRESLEPCDSLADVLSLLFPG